MNTMTKTQKGSITVPISIIIAGLIIAGAVVLSNNAPAQNAANPVDPNAPTGVPEPGAGQNLEAMNPVTDEDWIRGDANAPITIVEYSDFECPFCSSAHDTFKQLIAEYEGQVNWVFRHLPLTQIHPQAETIALAAECAGQLGSDADFWTAADAFFAEQSTIGTDEGMYAALAETGLDVTAIRQCVTDGTYQANIDADIENALATNSRVGTPWNIVVGPKGDLIPVSGALPYENFTGIIDALLEDAE
jgi:protein-disulfide isomerase